MKTFITLVAMLLSINSFAQQKAFPSAYGAGAYTTGGRGGVVYHVTNLNDSGAGSLRNGLGMTVPRIIVFDISGVIQLNSLLALDAVNSNVTIAGQTAPEGGITIDGARVYFNNVDNLICRYIRFKGGVDETYPSPDGNDSFSAVNDITNQIFDHCSFAFGVDEAASWYGTGSGDEVDDITIQRCLFAESTKGSIIGGQSGVGSITGDLSFINNLFYNCSYRFPNLAGDNANIDVINNVAWNVSGRIIRGNGSFNLNHIGNYNDFGNFPIEDRRVNLFAYGTIPQIYTNDNKIVAVNTTPPLTNTVSEMNANNQLSWKFFLDGGGYNYGEQLPSNYFANTQHTLRGAVFTTLTADQAFIDVSNNVGCNARINGDGSISDNKDVLDTDWLNQIASGNYVSVLSSQNYVVPSITSVTRPVDYDTDNDGMADLWETNTFGNLTKDGTGDDDNDGYTDLEEFLNLVDNSQQGPCSTKNAPVASLSSPLSVDYNENDTISFSVSYTSDTTVSSVSYYLNDSLQRTLTVSPYSFDTLGLSPGTYVTYAAVQDECGKTSNTAETTFTVSTSSSVLQVQACSLDSPPVIDGTEDNLWDNIPSHILGVTETGLTFPDSSDLSASYKIAWDANSLYFFIKVKDDILYSDSPQLEFFRDDAVSIFIDALDNNSTTYDSDDHYIGFRQGSTDIVINNSLYTGSGITKTDVVTSEGYDMEVKIDWSYLNLTPNINNNIGLDFRVDDDDDGGSRENHVLWNDETSTLWNDPSKFGILQLTNTNCDPDPCSTKNAPVASLSSPLSVDYNENDTISFSVSYTSDTTVSSVSYYLNDSLQRTLTVSPYSFDTLGLSPGTYVTYAAVQDECGKTSNTAETTFTVSTSSSVLQVQACSLDSPPVIDGTEDNLWDNIPSHILGVTETGLTFPDSSDLSASYKIAWDANSLYFFIKVKDDILYSDSPQLDFYRDDAVSIFIDALDNNSTTYDSDDHYIGFRQGSTDIVINNSLYTGSGITKTDVVTSEGYDMEVKIDWSYLNLTPNINNNIGLDFRVDDDDDGGSRENHVLWNDETSTLWNDPSKFGILQLTNTNCDPDPCSTKNAPVASLSSPLSVDYNENDTISFSVSYTSDTTVSSVSYYLNDSLQRTLTVSPYSFDTLGLSPGTYVTYAAVQDECGKTSNTAETTFTVSTSSSVLQVQACSLDSPPVIDGTEDNLWDNIPSHILGVTETGLTFPDSSDLSASYKIAWDANSLYFFIKVKDDILYSDSPQLDFYRDDAVSIFIDALDNNSTTYDSDDHYIGFRQGSTDIVINNSLYTGSGITKTDVVTSEGYDMEVKIDWSYLNLTPNINNNIGLDFRVDDDDDGGSRENHVLWNDETSTLWNDPSKFGILQLTNTNCDPDPCSTKNAPVASLSSPLSVDYNENDTISFSVSYTSDTTVSSVSYYLNDSLQRTLTVSPYSFDTLGLSPGTYVTYAAVQDECGKTSNTAETTFTVSTSSSVLQVQACSLDSPPVIDGTEDNLWDNIPSHILGVTETGLTFPDSSDLSASYKIAWDANSLYFFIKVKDDILYSDSPQLEFFRDDAVSIFIDALDNNSTTYDSDDHYIGFRQGSTDIVINNSLYTGSGITKTDVVTSEGYDMEVKIDWSYLNLTPNINNNIGLDFRVDDDDDGGSRENHVLWNDETSTLWNDPSKFGILQLTNTNCVTSMAGFGSLVSGYIAEDLTETAQGANIATWADSFGSNDGTSTDSTKTTLNLDNGIKEVLFNGAMFDLGTASDMNFIPTVHPWTCVFHVGSTLNISLDNVFFAQGGPAALSRQYYIYTRASGGGAMRPSYGGATAWSSVIAEPDDIITVVYDTNASTNGTVTIYKNGSQGYNAELSSSPRTTDNLYNSFIGGRSGSSLFDGSLKGVYIYNEALDQTAVSDIQTFLTSNSNARTSSSKNANTLTVEGEKEEFSIYPNPATSELNIRTPGTEKHFIYIYNSLGQEVFSLQKNISSYNIDIKSWLSGLYIIELRDLNLKLIGRNKLIVK